MQLALLDIIDYAMLALAISLVLYLIPRVRGVEARERMRLAGGYLSKVPTHYHPELYEYQPH